MTPEELLSPRYKVIADYPGNVQPIGHIFEVIGDPASVIYWCLEKDKYPHLFKPLQWWEDRQPEDMPEYVKIDIDQRIDIAYEKVDGERYTWEYIDGECCRLKHKNKTGVLIHYCTPATEAEYNEYIKQKEG